MGKTGWFGIAILCTAFWVLSGEPADSQQRNLPGMPGRLEVPNLPGQPSWNRKLLQASYEQLQKDTERLAELVTNLKEEVAKGNEDILPLSGVKKAEEIEKLAKKIKDRIKNL